MNTKETKAVQISSNDMNQLRGGFAMVATGISLANEIDPSSIDFFDNFLSTCTTNHCPNKGCVKPIKKEEEKKKGSKWNPRNWFS